MLILGRGRLGGSLARAWRAAGLRVRLAPGRSAPSGVGFAAVFLAVPDAAVPAVAARLARSLASRPLVAHCAGALDLSPLAALADRGVPVGSLHPLQAIPTPRERLRAFAAVDAPRAADRRALAALARAAGLTPFPLPGADRALYHAAAALASNGAVALAAQAATLLERCGAPPAAARGAAEALARSALGRPLTGPVARGDAAAVRGHLAALSAAAPTILPLYRALAQAQLDLSRAPAGARASIRRALTASGRAPARGRRRAPRAAPAPRRPRRGPASRAPRSS